MTDLLIATGNKGKVREIGEMLADAPFEIKGLEDFKNIENVAETGNIFVENAILKARGYALQAGVMALADDSGLEVAALDNRPGVFSARYGGEQAGYEDKVELLLKEMAETGSDDRRARFVCSMVLAAADGNILLTSEGICEGRIAFEPQGNQGFGYDPVFIPDGYTNTFGELENAIKQQISHRARAIKGIIAFLLDFKGI
jgi:XTP/dITP diphosphohydrolase